MLKIKHSLSKSRFVNDFLYQSQLSKELDKLLFTKRIEVNEKVNSFTIAKDSTLWVATDNGLFKVFKNSIQQYITGNSYNSSLISCIIIDDENIIWLGTYEGLFKYKSNGFLAFDAKDGTFNNYVFNVIRDNQGNLIATTGGGGFFVKYKDDKFRQYNTSNGLVDDFVWCAAADQENAVWLGTNKGISIFKNGKLFILYEGVIIVILFLFWKMGMDPDLIKIKFLEIFSGSG
jgi:ligand-binding sensor domain-containing protein